MLFTGSCGRNFTLVRHKPFIHANKKKKMVWLNRSGRKPAKFITLCIIFTFIEVPCFFLHVKFSYKFSHNFLFTINFVDRVSTPKHFQLYSYYLSTSNSLLQSGLSLHLPPPPLLLPSLAIISFLLTFPCLPHFPYPVF